MHALANKLGSALLALVGLLPLSWARLLARWQEIVLRHFDNDIHRITRINIQLARPALDARELHRLTCKSVQSTLVTAFEMPLIWRRDNEWMNKKICRVENESIIIEARDAGTGLIAICPHVGNWEVFGRKLAEYGPTTSLYQPPRQEYMENMVRAGRERSGARLVPTNQRGIAALLRALRNDEIVGILPDQVPKGDAGAFAPFFGIPAYTMTLVYSLVKRTGCRVILGYAIRSQRGFDIIFKPADDAIYDIEMASSLAAMNRMVEQSTEEDFSQYQWAYKRFKRQPDNSNPYKKNRD